MPPPRKIAFIAMPFGQKPTGPYAHDRAPAKVDFDELWNRAYFPALDNLGYLPVRADEQDGSLIIQDMIRQLTLADIVIADISIANANVYYEIGMRHGYSERGCILFSADWANPVFDLAQIRRATYSLKSETPSLEDYASIQKRLEQGLRELDPSSNPVKAFLDAEEHENSSSAHLKQAQDAVVELQTAIRACRLESSARRSQQIASEIIEKHDPQRLPDYAVRDLFMLARDVLGWGEAALFYESLTNEQQKLPELREQLALARSKTGNTSDAIAEVESLMHDSGATSERAQLIGRFYKQRYYSYSSKTHRRKKQLALKAAIKYYNEGFSLDLNDYSCSRNLLVLYLLSNEQDATDKAARMAIHILQVCDHKECTGTCDHWVAASRLIVAFYEQNVDLARELADQVAEFVGTRKMANWELATCIEFLEQLIGTMPDAAREDYYRIVDDFKLDISIEQSELRDALAALLDELGQDYEKFQQVKARNAEAGEKVVSVVDAGRETVNYAKDGDFVVENQTGAKELYIVSGMKFRERYEHAETLDDTWSLYKPVGRARGIQVNQRILKAFKQNDSFYIMAPWDEAQRVDEGDMLVTTLPLTTPVEIYRIAQKEFSETYQMIEGGMD